MSQRQGYYSDNEHSNASTSQYVSTGENSWTLIHREDLRSVRHNVVGFGNASIPSYECLVRNLPDRNITVTCITWNINEKAANILKTIANYLSNKQSMGLLEDVVCIAIQEIPPQSRLFHEESLTVFEPILDRTHSIYFSHRAWSQMLMIFLAKPHLRYAISEPTVKFVPCKAVAKPMRTKGSVGVCFRLYQRMIVVVASHFSHSSIQNRLANYHKMVGLLRFPTLRSFTGGDDQMFTADVILWMGDLNFRLSRGSVILPNVLPNPNDVLIYDELTSQMRNGNIFVGFHESRIEFAPTHKMKPNSQEYKEDRTPSYTDRVLYWQKQEGLICPVGYDSLDELTPSDHRPVVCSLRILAINRPIPDKYYSIAGPRTNQYFDIDELHHTQVNAQEI